ncbi:hypothetical protein BJ085DRAFT_5518, partial [Dimargaris cristalligena]
RGNLTPSQKINTVVGVSGLWGFILGSYVGGQKAGLQYRAEHMHKLPRSHQGWYFYHKHKNYRMMLQGIYRGTAYATKFMAICGAFTVSETALDVWKGDTDFTSTLTAAFATALAFCVINKLPKQSSRYAMRIGTISGLTIGLTQDLLHYYQGMPPFYIDWLKR